MTSHDEHAGTGHPSREFATTHWSVVLAAAERGTPRSQAALARLCETYWFPLYAFLRRQGSATHDAEDLTQAFFARVLDKNYLADVDRRRGKFRSFLLASLRHFVANERDRARAKKRGGGRCTLSLDFPSAEKRYTLEPVDDLTPERLFERQWALELLSRVLERLQTELTAAGKAAWFDALKPLLTADSHTPPYARVAERLGQSESAVKVAVHRLRRRYRRLLRDEVAQTVADPAEIDDELRQLVAALRQ
ncbi:MAG TPA: ECF-type sigma factor [Pirellulales bacterium]|nr:ECF-type sigma factor [Pirellulales bacterium]